MVNIDFHEQVAQQKENSNRSIFSFLLGGWQIALVLLVVTFVIYGVSYFYKNRIEKNIVHVENIINQEKNGINKEDIKKVRGLTIRRDIIKKENEKVKSDAEEKLEMIEKDLNQGVYLTDYNYNKKESSLKVKAVAASYHVVAQQIYDFENDNNISSVKISSASKNEDGEINFDLELRIK